MTIRHVPARAVPTDGQLARRYSLIVAEEIDRLEGAIALEEAERLNRVMRRR